MTESGQPDTREKRRFDSESANNVVQIVAIIAAGLWALYTFIYQAEIVPGLAPPTLSVTCTLEKSGQRGSQVAIRSTVTRSNVGQTAIRLLGITYNVIGIKQKFLTDGATNPAFDGTIPAEAQVETARYYGTPERSEVILRAGTLFAGATGMTANLAELNPGESLSRDMIFYADQDRYDLIRVHVRLLYGKTSEPPVRLEFGLKDGGLTASCQENLGLCRGLNATDFTTELSLW